ncbi:MucR family transcriptional regulator [Sphingomonas sp.]|uniref:MucR family transcriptional regulator n=1 Tax=Sphingomonas sp. TaxID=28214 RepID=UPI002FC59499
MADVASEALLTLTTDIVAAHVSNNPVAVVDLPRLIGAVYAALRGSGVKAQPVRPQQPAVPRRSSVKPDFIICLEDGKKVLMLKPHLKTDHQMTPSQYRAKWNLGSDYPMVSPNYSEKRRTIARQIGLGRRIAGSAPSAKPSTRGATTNARTRRPRKPGPERASGN